MHSTSSMSKLISLLILSLIIVMPAFAFFWDAPEQEIQTLVTTPSIPLAPGIWIIHKVDHYTINGIPYYSLMVIRQNYVRYFENLTSYPGKEGDYINLKQMIKSNPHIIIYDFYNGTVW